MEITGIEGDGDVSGLTFDTYDVHSGSWRFTDSDSDVSEFEQKGHFRVISLFRVMIQIVQPSTLSVSITVQPPPAPAISVQQTAVDFGTVAFAQSVQQTITIQNTGTASLEITDIQSDVSGLTFDTTMFTVESGGSQTVTVTFPSSAEGTFSGNITISSNDPNSATSTLSISITVQPPPAPAISVPQTAVDFGTVAFAQQVQRTITVQNTGTASLEITGIESDVSGLTFEPYCVHSGIWRFADGDSDISEFYGRHVFW